MCTNFKKGDLLITNSYLSLYKKKNLKITFIYSSNTSNCVLDREINVTDFELHIYRVRNVNLNGVNENIQLFFICIILYLIFNIIKADILCLCKSRNKFINWAFCEIPFSLLIRKS